ncbi:MAG: hypothetical protein M1575_02645 [Patescibacteria group bacterium]|nr:hypothetical protein [Patescibacteria group bacterium]MCL5095602.1 hypothetical protein [Patescibacteria group bacterium]
MSNSDDNHGFLSGLFLGGLLGAGLIVFMGTKEGKKIAEQLKDKGEDLANELEGKIQEVQEKALEIKEEATDQTLEKLDNALAKLEDAQARAQETTETIRRKFFTRQGKKLT